MMLVCVLVSFNRGREKMIESDLSSESVRNMSEHFCAWHKWPITCVTLPRVCSLMTLANRGFRHSRVVRACPSGLRSSVIHSGAASLDQKRDNPDCSRVLKLLLYTDRNSITTWNLLKLVRKFPYIWVKTCDKHIFYTEFFIWISCAFDLPRQGHYLN